MAAIVSFIGWHDSGKTTLATGVVASLKQMGYRVAVIKSSSEKNIEFDTPDTDTFKHKQAGADSVMIVAPDQMVLQTKQKDLSLTTLAHRYFPDVDIIIAEGFKQARHIAKIEVVRNPDQQLRKKVHGVLAVATDLQITADYVFRLDEAEEIALFIEKRFLQQKQKKKERTALLVNGRKIVLKSFIQESLAGTVKGYVESLKLTENIDEIELLPALPAEWPSGEIKGVLARGGFEVDMKWENGVPVNVKVKSLSGNKTNVLFNRKSQTVDLQKGESIELEF